MSKHIGARAPLTGGASIPWLGFGLYNITDAKVLRRAIDTALDSGYRAFDNATLYGNETEVGAALAASGLPREELFITSKVWNGEQGYAETLAAFQRSLERLRLDHLDLYLLHWPVPGKFEDSWRALEKLYRDGLVKAIGVSNFERHHLRRLIARGEIRPALNQVELHPELARDELERWCTGEGIRLQAWSPLQHGKILAHPVLRDIARAHGRSPAQIVLAWLLARDIAVVPKAATPAHIRDNAGVFDLELTPADIARIDALDAGRRIGPDPDTVDYAGDEEFVRIFSSWERPLAA